MSLGTKQNESKVILLPRSAVNSAPKREEEGEQIFYI